jgi:hypothetical protein
MLLKEAHIEFLNYLESIKNYSQKTIEQYDRHITKFQNFLEIKKMSSLDVEDLNLKILEDFRSFLYKENKEISIKTANAYMITMRSFLKFL